MRLLSKSPIRPRSWCETRAACCCASAISMTVQCLFVVINIGFARAAHVDAPVAAWFYAWTTAKIIAIAPISLGGLGVREASMAGLLRPFGADPAQVMAIGLVWQSLLYVSGLIGFLFNCAAPLPQGQNGASVVEQVVVLGAGPAGVGAALMLAKSGKAPAKVLERAPRVGGIREASFSKASTAISEAIAFTRRPSRN